jgi:hypothetical protein
MQCTHSTFLESVVIGFEDISTFSSNALASELQSLTRPLLEHRIDFVGFHGSLQGFLF